MTTISELISKRESVAFRFRPKGDFYVKVGINRKRWGLIYRGEIEPVVSELQRIAEFFNVDVTDLLDFKTKNHD
jgi:DNA-binding Xre family transcriptional regulator